MLNAVRMRKKTRLPYPAPPRPHGPPHQRDPSACAVLDTPLGLAKRAGPRAPPSRCPAHAHCRKATPGQGFSSRPGGASEAPPISPRGRGGPAVTKRPRPGVDGAGASARGRALWKPALYSPSLSAVRLRRRWRRRVGGARAGLRPPPPRGVVIETAAAREEVRLWRRV